MARLTALNGDFFRVGQCPSQLLVVETTVALTVTLDADLDSIDRDRAAFERKFEVRAAPCALESFCSCICIQNEHGMQIT